MHRSWKPQLAVGTFCPTCQLSTFLTSTIDRILGWSGQQRFLCLWFADLFSTFLRHGYQRNLRRSKNCYSTLFSKLLFLANRSTDGLYMYWVNEISQCTCSFSATAVFCMDFNQTWQPSSTVSQLQSLCFFEPLWPQMAYNGPIHFPLLHCIAWISKKLERRQVLYQICLSSQTVERWLSGTLMHDIRSFGPLVHIN